jgi:hypothetical protein
MTTIKTLCTVCQCDLLLQWPDKMTFAGAECTAQEYASNALRSETVYLVCDSCLAKMPDVRIEDLQISPHL